MIGVPNTWIPFLANSIRQINYRIQWNKRIDEAIFLFNEFKKGQHDVSPVYRFRGGSSTLKQHLGGPVQSPVSSSHVPKTRMEKIRSKIDPSSVFMGGLAFVVIASIGGPALAKKVNWTDPLDAANQRLENLQPR